MSALFSIYIAHLRVSLAVQFQYRVAMVIWMIGLVLEPVIYLSVWSAIAETKGGMVGGFTGADFAAYYIVMLVVSHFTMIWHMWEYDFNIRQGLLSGRLLRPLHPIHRDVAENIAYKTLMLIVLVPSVLFLAFLFKPAFHPPLWALLAFFPAVALSGLIAFLAGWTIAMAAFWTTRISAINEMYYVILLFFSGQIAPLALLPETMQAISFLMPFRWFMSFPAELLLGRLTPGEFVNGLLMQFIWVFLTGCSVFLAWKNGIKRYSAVGG